MVMLKMNDKKLIYVLITGAALLIVFNIINTLIGEPLWQITRLIDVGREANLPAWFSSMLLAIAAIYAYNCSEVYKSDKTGRKIWQMVALFFLGMSCDEGAEIHENLGHTINKYFFKFSAIKHSEWVAILGPVILIGVVVLVIKMRRYVTGSPAVRWLLFGLFSYLGGALLLESTINFLNHETLEWLFRMENILEETGEMFGVILIIKGLSVHHDFLLTDQKVE